MNIILYHLIFNLLTTIILTAKGDKQKISRYLKKIFMSKEFGTVMSLINEIVECYSILKFVLRHLRRSECIRDDLKVRGSWKNPNR